MGVSPGGRSSTALLLILIVTGFIPGLLIYWSERRRAQKSPPRPHDAVNHPDDDAGNLIETHKHKGDFKEP